MASKTLASLVVRIGADVTGVTAGLSTLDKRIRATKRELSTLRDSTLTVSGALKLLAGATGAALAAKKIFDVGAAVEETASKFRTVMGPATDEAQQFLREFANTAGLTNQKGQDLLATTAAIAQGMGFSQRASVGFAQSIVKLSADLSSFNNLPIEETSLAIQRALTGERESLKKLGIVVLEADVQKRAMAETGKTVAASLTQQEKATATLSLITERAGVAMGDLARTMDSPANQARKLTAQFFDVRDAMAHAMLPAMGEVLKALGEQVGGFQQFGSTLEANSGRIAAWARFAIQAFKFVALAIAAPIRVAFNLGQAIGSLFTFVGNAAGNLGSAIALLVTGQFKAAADAMKTLVSDVVSDRARYNSQFTDMGRAITDIVGSFDEMRIASGDAWSTTKDGAVAVQTLTTNLQNNAIALTNNAEAAKRVRDALNQMVPPNAIEEMRQALRDAEAVRREKARDIANSLGGTPGANIKVDPTKSAARTFAAGGGGVLGALGNAFGSIGSKFKDLVSGLGGILSALAPWKLLMEAVGRALGDFLANTTPIVEVLARALMPILKALFPILKMLVIAATYVGQVFFKVAEGIAKAIGYAVYGIGKAIDALPFISGKKIINFGRDLINLGKGFGEASHALGEARDDIRGMEWVDAAKPVEDLADAARKAAEALEQQRVVLEDLAVRGYRAVGMGDMGDRAAMVFSQRRERLEFTARGATAEEMGLLTIVHKIERDSMELRQSVQAQTEAIQAAADAQVSAIDEQVRVAQDALAVAQDQLQAQQRFADDIRNVLDSLERFQSDLKLGDLSPLSPLDKLAEARAQFGMLGSLARGGDVTAAQSLPEAARQLLDLSRSVNASSTGFVRDFNSVTSVVSAVQEQFKGQLTVEEQILAELQSQTARLNQQIGALAAQKTAIETAARDQIGALQTELQRQLTGMATELQKALGDVQVLKDSLEQLKSVNTNTGNDYLQTRSNLDTIQTTVIPALNKYYADLLQAKDAAAEQERNYLVATINRMIGSVDGLAGAVTSSYEDLQRTMERME